MQSEEQKLIDDLFGRLKQAESQSGNRDSGAEQRIQQHVQSQPGAPYYMAQAIIIQEAAMKKLNERITELENKLTQQPAQSSGGFLSGLFGGSSSNPQSQPAQQPAGWGNSAQSAQQPQSYNAPQAARSSFLGGAVQTAVGVAGGMVMANMLTSMFHNSQPEEIVNIINEPPRDQPDYDTEQSTLNQDAHASDFSQSSQDDAQANNSNDSLFGDSFNGDDDDSFL